MGRWKMGEPLWKWLTQTTFNFSSTLLSVQKGEDWLLVRRLFQKAEQPFPALFKERLLRTNRRHNVPFKFDYRCIIMRCLYIFKYLHSNYIRRKFNTWVSFRLRSSICLPLLSVSCLRLSMMEEEPLLPETVLRKSSWPPSPGTPRVSSKLDRCRWNASGFPKLLPVPRVAYLLCFSC